MSGRVMPYIMRVTAWVSVLVLALTGLVLAFPTFIQARNVLNGGGDFYLLLVQLLGEATIIVMIVLSLYAIVPQRVRLSPVGVATLGIVAFVGMFFLILLVLRGEPYAAIPVLVYFVRIRRDLAEELPVAAGGRRKTMPKAKKRRDPNAVTRPPRAWDPDGGRRPASKAAPAAKRRRKGKKRRPG